MISWSWDCVREDFFLERIRWDDRFGWPLEINIVNMGLHAHPERKPLSYESRVAIRNLFPLIGLAFVVVLWLWDGCFKSRGFFTWIINRCFWQWTSVCSVPIIVETWPYQRGDCIIVLLLHIESCCCFVALSLQHFIILLQCWEKVIYIFFFFFPFHLAKKFFLIFQISPPPPQKKIH